MAKKNQWWPWFFLLLGLVNWGIKALSFKNLASSFSSSVKEMTGKAKKAIEENPKKSTAMGLLGGFAAQKYMANDPEKQDLYLDHQAVAKDDIVKLEKEAIIGPKDSKTFGKKSLFKNSQKKVVEKKIQRRDDDYIDYDYVDDGPHDMDNIEPYPRKSFSTSSFNLPSKKINEYENSNEDDFIVYPLAEKSPQVIEPVHGEPDVYQSVEKGADQSFEEFVVPIVQEVIKEKSKKNDMNATVIEERLKVKETILPVIEEDASPPIIEEFIKENSQSTVIVTPKVEYIKEKLNEQETTSPLIPTEIAKATSIERETTSQKIPEEIPNTKSNVQFTAGVIPEEIPKSSLKVKSPPVIPEKIVNTTSNLQPTAGVIPEKIVNTTSNVQPKTGVIPREIVNTTSNLQPTAGVIPREIVNITSNVKENNQAGIPEKIPNTTSNVQPTNEPILDKIPKVKLTEKDTRPGISMEKDPTPPVIKFIPDPIIQIPIISRSTDQNRFKIIIERTMEESQSQQPLSELPVERSIYKSSEIPPQGFVMVQKPPLLKIQEEVFNGLLDPPLEENSKKNKDDGNISTHEQNSFTHPMVAEKLKELDILAIDSTQQPKNLTQKNPQIQYIMEDEDKEEEDDNDHQFNGNGQDNYQYNYENNYEQNWSTPSKNFPNQPKSRSSSDNRLPIQMVNQKNLQKKKDYWSNINIDLSKVSVIPVYNETKGITMREVGNGATTYEKFRQKIEAKKKITAKSVQTPKKTVPKFLKLFNEFNRNYSSCRKNKTDSKNLAIISTVH
jgi:hypothetical protein